VGVALPEECRLCRLLVCRIIEKKKQKEKATYSEKLVSEKKKVRRKRGF